LGGNLEIESSAGAGTEFRIDFPAEGPAGAPAEDRAAGGDPREARG
jgi:hypothetical protein